MSEYSYKYYIFFFTLRLLGKNEKNKALQPSCGQKVYPFNSVENTTFAIVAYFVYGSASMSALVGLTTPWCTSRRAGYGTTTVI